MFDNECGDANTRRAAQFHAEKAAETVWERSQPKMRA